MKIPISKIRVTKRRSPLKKFTRIVVACIFHRICSIPYDEIPVEVQNIMSDYDLAFSPFGSICLKEDLSVV